MRPSVAIFLIFSSIFGEPESSAYRVVTEFSMAGVPRSILVGFISSPGPHTLSPPLISACFILSL